MFHHIRSFVLPTAIVLGLLLHRWCEAGAVIVPYLIFLILLLNFTAVNLRKLRFTRIHLWVMLFQTVVCIGGYGLARLLTGDEILSEGVLIGILCPVASSVVVVAAMLGADRNTTTSYTITGNLLVAVLAPVCFSFIGTNQDWSFSHSFLLIFGKISPVIALPFFVALTMQLLIPRVSKALSRYKDWSFYLWALALLLTLGQTIHFIFKHGEGNGSSILALGIVSAAVCFIHFGVGKWIGSHYGDRVAGGQMLGQKNTAVGIWMGQYLPQPTGFRLPGLLLHLAKLVQQLAVVGTRPPECKETWLAKRFGRIISYLCPRFSEQINNSLI